MAAWVRRRNQEVLSPADADKLTKMDDERNLNGLSLADAAEM